MFYYYVIFPDVEQYIRSLGENQSGFHIKYRVGVSRFGRGIFTKQNIEKGTLVWNGVYGRNTRRFISEKEVRQWLAEMSNDKDREEWLRFPVVFDGGFELDMDDARFINHNSEPNMGYLSMEDSRSFALRDIKKGEELFEDYNGYDYTISPPEWIAKLYLEYGIDESFLDSR